MVIQILVDSPDSWILPYALKLENKLIERGSETTLLHRHKDVRKGDILCLLSCERIFKALHLNKHNLVVHESELPAGKGWSPLTWQILEGKNEVPISLFEATNEVDAGPIYLQDKMFFEGHELLSELKDMQGEKTIELILRFVDNYPIKGIKQEGKSTYYQRRKPEDSKLDLNQSIDAQFNLMRVCDNERYPAFFIKDGIKYVIKIEKTTT